MRRRRKDKRGRLLRVKLGQSSICVKINYKTNALQFSYNVKERVVSVSSREGGQRQQPQ